MAIFSLLVVSLGSCRRRQTDENLVIVRVFRDSKSDFSSALDRRLYGFNDYKNQRRTSSGKVIFVATMEPFDYRSELAGKIAQVKPQLVILDFPEDAKLLEGVQFDLLRLKSACGRNRNCPAFIPSWVTGEELEATERVFTEITRE